MSVDNFTVGRTPSKRGRKFDRGAPPAAVAALDHQLRRLEWLESPEGPPPRGLTIDTARAYAEMLDRATPASMRMTETGAGNLGYGHHDRADGRPRAR